MSVAQKEFSGDLIMNARIELHCKHLFRIVVGVALAGILQSCSGSNFQAGGVGPRASKKADQPGTAANAGVAAIEETAQANTDPGVDLTEVLGVVGTVTVENGAGFQLNVQTGQIITYSTGAKAIVTVWAHALTKYTGTPEWIRFRVQKEISAGETIQLPGDWSKVDHTKKTGTGGRPLVQEVAHIYNPFAVCEGSDPSTEGPLACKVMNATGGIMVCNVQGAGCKTFTGQEQIDVMKKQAKDRMAVLQAEQNGQ